MRTGLVQGSWDLFHIGHLKYLLEAKKRCDYLIVGVDGDDKIRQRKGPFRPIVPENERKEFIELLGVASEVVIKRADDPKWSLIKKVHPDVLICIKENYTDEEIEQLREFCGEIAVLPRQAETSTSAQIRKVIISSQAVKENTNPTAILREALKLSTDIRRPNAAACKLNGVWYTGASQADYTLPAKDVEQRTELFYGTVEHAEINLLKKLRVDHYDGAVYCTLFPCDKCLKVMIDKGINTIYYYDDHPDKRWSKRSHELAERKGIKTVWMGKEHKDSLNDKDN